MKNEIRLYSVGGKNFLEKNTNALENTRSLSSPIAINQPIKKSGPSSTSSSSSEGVVSALDAYSPHSYEDKKKEEERKLFFEEYWNSLHHKKSGKIKSDSANTQKDTSAESEILFDMEDLDVHPQNLLHSPNPSIGFHRQITGGDNIPTLLLGVDEEKEVDLE